MNLAEQIELACLIEATARKPGNVHPGASFDDLTYDDFVTAARISAPILARSGELGVGRVVLEAVKATVTETGTNVNLGICLLIAPLAAAPTDQLLESGVKEVLQSLTVDDARLVYEAIRLANPGGLGEAPQQDVRDEPTQTLLEVMALASERDGIAGQYATKFHQCVAVSPKIMSGRYRWAEGVELPAAGDSVPYVAWEFATIATQLRLLARDGDTLIQRKSGASVSQDVARQATFVWQQDFDSPMTWIFLDDFDELLRNDGNQLNPGTTADLIAAIWFAAIRDGLIVPPMKAEVLSHAARIRNAGRMREGKQERR